MKNLTILCFLIFCFLFFSCKDSVDDIPISPISDHEMVESEGMIQLGREIENPYSLDVMRKALTSLFPNGRVTSEDIVATHFYVKFHPKNETDLDRLQDDTLTIFHTYPLHYEMQSGGTYYHDPEIPNNKPTYQYAVVPVDYQFPEVKYKILEEIYLPPLDEGVSSARTLGLSKTDLIKLENRALELTDNLEYVIELPEDDEPCDSCDPGDTGDGGGTSSSPCTTCPFGRILIQDDVAGRPVPIVGAKVIGYKLFRSYEAYTDNDGRFVINWRDAGAINWKIKWERYHYSIREGDWFQAVTTRDGSRSFWNHTIGNDTHSQYFALIHQAAYDYYYGNNFGLSRPPLNSSTTPQLKIAAKIEPWIAENSHAAVYYSYFNLIPGPNLPDVFIRTYGEASDRVYAVTAHELAHMAHWNLDKDAFVNLVYGAYLPPKKAGDERVIESWAEGVEWWFAIGRYRNEFGNGGYNYLLNYQRRQINDPLWNIYSSVVVDLHDDVNQRFEWGSILFPDDEVVGYEIDEIEEALRGVRSWTGWQNNIINRLDNSTENEVDNLFANWN
ncbi:hypothetical protein [Marinoscillum sp.]|uniref:hypothetical protein n=1 Tax=Marinoscillum sp. TaxID=2024838 RepID=UPI003BA9E561